jgi:hypothetical protein
VEGDRLLPRIFASSIVTHPFASVASVSETAVTPRERGREVTLEDVDTVVLAGWPQPVTGLYFDVKASGIPVERVGDAIASRSMLEAVHEGERAARRI